MSGRDRAAERLRKEGDFTRCHICKVSRDYEQLYITPDRFQWQYAYCLDHYMERVGSFPTGADSGPEYEPYDMDA